MSSLSHKLVKTRKAHQCFSCFRLFPAGSELYKWTSVYEGSICSGYTCHTCNEIFDLSEHDGDGFPEGYTRECLSKGQTPEEYLIEIIENHLTHTH